MQGSQSVQFIYICNKRHSNRKSSNRVVLIVFGERETEKSSGKKEFFYKPTPTSEVDLGENKSITCRIRAL